VKEAEEEKKLVNKDRCSTCSRKLRLLGVECRCGLFFCNSHRLPEDHSCSFNHKTHGKEKLTKQVVKVQNGKIEAI
jgi:predicted nucleic acid binding AN1-type Zn finger protein